MNTKYNFSWPIILKLQLTIKNFCHSCKLTTIDFIRKRGFLQQRQKAKIRWIKD